ncbi:TPA: hypothetical protein HA318_02135, partial [Candidatus Micrarchaeota archaeon]|nr:hypothetical protein [Candidatus Micrarchaeota archaeon]
EVSSETALSTAQPYLKKGEAASITGKYSVKDNAYWMVYFHPENYPSTKNLVVVVEAQSGGLVSERELLRQLHSLDFRASELSSFASSNSVSFARLRLLADNFRNKLDSLDNSANPASIHAISSAVERNFTELDFERAITALDGARDYWDSLDDSIASGVDAELNYAQSDVNQKTQNSLVLAFNASFKRISVFLQKVDAYEDELLELSQAAAAAHGQAASQIILQLNLLTFADSGSTGQDRYSELVRFNESGKRFTQIFAREATGVNDSVQSFIDRKNFVDNSTNAVQDYARLLPYVEAITSTRSTQYESCDVDTVAIATSWKQVKDPRSADFTNSEPYARIVQQLAEISPKVDAARKKYDKCLESREKSAQAVTAEEKQDWLAPALI